MRTAIAIVTGFLVMQALGSLIVWMVGRASNYTANPDSPFVFLAPLTGGLVCGLAAEKHKVWHAVALAAPVMAFAIGVSIGAWDRLGIAMVLTRVALIPALIVAGGWLSTRVARRAAPPG